MRPSQVRGRVLQDHAALRIRLDELEEATRALRTGAERAVERALAVAAELHRELNRHLDLEDALLAPALRDIDSWGPIRAERLTRHHAEQRAQLHAIAQRSREERSASALAALLGELIEDLREDMSYEESDVLSTELLRDDLTTTGEDG